MHRDGTITLNGQRFHYTEWGAATAPALLMLHRATGHARTWDEEAGAFASRYRVLALDQRGHGYSDPSPELFASLEHALAFRRLTNPLFTEAVLRHRVEHGTRPVDGGLTWKYDRGLRDAVRAGTWRDPIDLWPLWR